MATRTGQASAARRVRRLAALAVALLVAGAGLAACSRGRQAPPPAGQAAALAGLTSLDPVARWFTARTDQPRLVLILSPT